MHRIIIPGPPGTGKTHRLMQLLDNELNLIKTDPEKIAYIAFSNAAANVAKERIKNDKIYVSTMHSMGSQECNFNTKTQLYHDLPSLKAISDVWPDPCRCTLVKVNKGGWFPYHRDSVLLNRRTFRIIAFFTNTGSESYQWEHDDTIRTIEEGRCYYVNTQLAHRTHSYVPDSIHLVMNIPKTLENVFRVMDILKHGET